jgi:hypothetical protein
MSLAILVFLPPLRAQSTAKLGGSVIDGSNARVADVDISVLEIDQNISRHTITSATGDFSIPLLQPGRYSVGASKSGFEITEVRNVVLAAGDDLHLELRVQVGRTYQTVQVAAITPGVEARTSSLGATVMETSVRNLPLNGRNYVNLVQLTIGAAEGPPNGFLSGTRPDDRRQTASVSVNGQSDVLNNNTIDWMDNNERAIGTIGARPSLEAIAEIQVRSNLYTAEVGRTAGAVINIVTKSGTNDFHGTAYEFFRNDKFDARNFFAILGAAPEYRRSQFGASLGGPIRKNRTFFFGDYEGFRMVQDSTALLTVPTLGQAGGILSGVASPIVDPGNNAPFPANIVPASRINPIASKYMALYPAPNLPGNVNNYQSTSGKTQFSHTVDGRIDHHLDDRDLLFARYTLNDVSTDISGALPAVNGVQPGGSAYPGMSLQWAHNAMLNYVHIVSPRLLLELRTGYTRIDFASYPLNFGKNLAAAFGMTGVNVSQLTSMLPPMYVSGYPTLGDSINLPMWYIDNTYQYDGAATYILGSHNLKTGATLIRRQVLAYQSASPAGRYTFNSSPAGNSIASFLLGIPYSTQRVLELAAPGYRTWQPGVYLQDDWRAARWLTLNIGVRFDLFTPYTEANNHLSNFDLGSGRMLLAGANGVSRTAGVETDYTNLAPRFGFAAKLGRGLVLRGGFGMTFFPGNYTSAAYLTNPPYMFTYGPVQFVPLGSLPVPVPSDPNNPSGSLYAEALNFRSSYLHQFNIDVQRELGANVLSVAYVGELGRHVPQLLPNINLPLPSPAPDPLTRAPYASQVPNVSALGFLQSNGTSSYSALQVSFQRRYTNGLTLNANYAWAHGIDDASTFSVGYGGGIYLVPSAIGSYDRGNSDLDIRHRLVVAANYEIPSPGLRQRALRRVLSAWQINSVAVWQTGLPFTVIDANPRANLGSSVTYDRPDVVRSPALPSPGIDAWFDTSAFIPQPFGALGNVGRNTLHGPPQRRLDLSLFKEFSVRDAWRLEFRLEAFNLTNTPSFANPNAILGNASFGTVTSTPASSTPRQLQLALKMLF